MQLPGDVEAILHAREDKAAPDQYVDPISLAGLIVSVASLAWTIYRDLRSKADLPAREIIERRIRIEVGDGDTSASPAQRDRIIEAVIDEIVGSTEP